MTLTIMSAAKGSQRHGETGYGISGKSDFFRFSSRSQRKLGSNPFSASERIYKDDPGRKEIDTIVLAQACERARATAYKAVMKPKEGTILTVAKGIAQKAAEMAEVTDDLEEFLPAVLAYAKEVLDQTPEMLPVLKRSRRSGFRRTGTSGSVTWRL